VEKSNKRARKSVSKFFKSIENFDESAIYAINITNKFRKSVKLCYSRNLDLELLENVIYTLAQGKSLDAKYFPHQLKGFKQRPNEKVMECHIHPDWLFVWTQNDIELILLLVNTGSHADLF
jgi:mRNA interferase YafQ